MDKLIDLESIKSMISSVVNENKMTDEEIAECGAACGCGTTTADLGAEVQYLGDKKKKEGILGGIAGGIIGNEIGSGYPIAGACLGSIAQDILTPDDDKDKKEFLDFGTTKVNGNGTKVLNDEPDKDLEKKEFLDANATLSDVNVLGYMKKDSDNQKESTLEEDEVEEMARGVLAPQEQARRDYIAEYPEYKDVLKRADQFMKQVLNNPEAPGYEKYVKHFANLLKNGNRGTWSNVSSAYELNTDKRANNKKLATDYANTILNHRKNMGKASYASKGTMNAYQRNIVKRGSYYKPGRDMVEPEQTVGMSLGQQIADQYNSVPVEQSNSVLAKFFKSADWNNLSASDKYRTIKAINDEADLDMAGVELVNKAKMNIGDDE